MTLDPLTSLQSDVALGEDSTRQFKSDIRSAESLASEIAAFANAEGGTIYIGVADDGELRGLNTKDVGRINQLISNAATQLISSPVIVRTQNIANGGRVVIKVSVPKGIDKPYFDKKGVIWLKVGADKRRIQSKEELRRLFQMTDQIHADELPTSAGLKDLDSLRFRDFVETGLKADMPQDEPELLRLLKNLNLATETGSLNLAGVLMFARYPQRIKPQFVVKAIHFPGREFHQTDYLDSEDFEGPLAQIYADSLAFIMRNLRKVQAGRGVNSPGIPEIPTTVFEELLVNALVHRDYFVSAPIRILVFEDRIEIVSPGHLPNNLTVEKIRSGNSNIRNPILASFVARGLLPYHGLGSGIRRALAAWPQIELKDDREGCLFTATIQREHENGGNDPVNGGNDPVNGGNDPVNGGNDPVNGGNGGNEPVEMTLNTVQTQIVRVLQQSPQATYEDLMAKTGKSRRTVMRHLAHLKQAGILTRVGSPKVGHWIVSLSVKDPERI